MKDGTKKFSEELSFKLWQVKDQLLGLEEVWYEPKSKGIFYKRRYVQEKRMWNDLKPVVLENCQNTTFYDGSDHSKIAWVFDKLKNADRKIASDLLDLLNGNIGSLIIEIREKEKEGFIEHLANGGIDIYIMLMPNYRFYVDIDKVYIDGDKIDVVVSKKKNL